MPPSPVGSSSWCWTSLCVIAQAPPFAAWALMLADLRPQAKPRTLFGSVVPRASSPTTSSPDVVQPLQEIPASDQVPTVYDDRIRSVVPTQLIVFAGGELALRRIEQPLRSIQVRCDTAPTHGLGRVCSRELFEDRARARAVRRREGSLWRVA